MAEQRATKVETKDGTTSFGLPCEDGESVLRRDEGKPVPDAKNVSMGVPRSCEGMSPGTEVCIGEELASPAMGVKTVACSEARATFTEFMTADKRAGSRAAGGEKGEPATDVNMGGTNWNYRVYHHVCQRRINIQGFQSEQRVAKETS